MSGKKKSGNPIIDLTAGGVAGCCEALSCHPLDTIKVQLQIQGKTIAAANQAAKQAAEAAVAGASGPDAAKLKATAEAKAGKVQSLLDNRRGFAGTGKRIYGKYGIRGLYRGLGAVITGITPKMSIRFWSFEELKRLWTGATGGLSTLGIFLSGIGAGTIEAVAVVNPMEVVKIRLQTQSHSMTDPTQGPKYKNAFHCFFTVIREEGPGAIYRGVALTAARQATNQGTNFTIYTLLKQQLTAMQPEHNGMLPGWQTSLIGLTSGALGPFSNAPLDVIKTRMQRERRIPGESGFKQGSRLLKELVTHEGPRALWRGITPRVMRVAPGQAVTFTVYERVRTAMEALPIFQKPLSA